MPRRDEHIPFTLQRIPKEWIDKYFDAYACHVIPNPDAGEVTKDEELFMAIIHFMNCHRMLSLNDIYKIVRTSNRKVMLLRKKFIIHC